MKKKVGELYDKPVVIGNPNEFTKNEIDLKSLDTLSSVFSFYLLKNSKAEEWFNESKWTPFDNFTEVMHPFCVWYTRDYISSHYMRGGNIRGILCIKNFINLRDNNSNMYGVDYEEITNLINEYFIEIDAKSLFNLPTSNDFLIYNYKDLNAVRKAVRNFANSLNLKDGEVYYVPDGKQMCITAAADDWGFVISIRKGESEEDFVIKECRNGQVAEIPLSNW